MQTENGILYELKRVYNNGSMTVKLVFINVIVFIFIACIEIIMRLFNLNASLLIDSVFGMMTNSKDFISHPWGIITHMFTHYSFLHLLFNMLMLYGSGQIFERFFDSKRLLYTYLLGGVCGGLLELLEHAVVFKNSSTLIGASGSVMAILVAIGFYQPRLKVSLWGILSIRIMWIAIALILINLYNAGMGTMDGTAYFAHIGGGLLGYISIQRPFSSNNIVQKTIVLSDKIKMLFTKNYKKRTAHTKRKFFKTNKSVKQKKYKTDEQYNMEVRSRQEQIDGILDKISRSGYDSLTKQEKDLLFRQTNR